MKKYLLTLIQGMLMGVAEIIPGVSGSTLAISMGIYDRILDVFYQISEVLRSAIDWLRGRIAVAEIKQRVLALGWGFALPLGIGALVSIIILSNIVTTLLESYTQYVYALFFGIILASLVTPAKEIGKFTWKTYALITVTAVVLFLTLGLPTYQKIEDPHVALMFVCGILGITGMILPAVSGSFILLVIGVYPYIVDSIKQFTHLQFEWNRVVNMFVFGLGLLTGFSTIVRVLKYLLEKYRRQTMSVVIGLMLGSLRVIWPFFYKFGGVEDRRILAIWELPNLPLSESILILGLILLGIVSVLLIELFVSKKPIKS